MLRCVLCITQHITFTETQPSFLRTNRVGVSHFSPLQKRPASHITREEKIQWTQSTLSGGGVSATTYKQCAPISIPSNPAVHPRHPTHHICRLLWLSQCLQSFPTEPSGDTWMTSVLKRGLKNKTGTAIQRVPPLGTARWVGEGGFWPLPSCFFFGGGRGFKTPPSFNLAWSACIFLPYKLHWPKAPHFFLSPFVSPPPLPSLLGGGGGISHPPSFEREEGE